MNRSSVACCVVGLVGLLLLAPDAVVGQKSMPGASPNAVGLRRRMGGTAARPPWQRLKGLSRKAIYAAPDRRAVALVSYDRPIPGWREEASRVIVKDSRGRTVASRDYTADGTGGYKIICAAWVPDSRFFVFSTESSGGHSPWHFPTHWYDRKRRQFCCLEGFDWVVTNPAFTIRSPARATVQVWFDRRQTLDLQHLSRRRRKLAAAYERIFPPNGY